MNCIFMVQDMVHSLLLVKVVNILWVPLEAGNFLTNWVALSFSRPVLGAVSFIL